MKRDLVLCSVRDITRFRGSSSRIVHIEYGEDSEIKCANWLAENNLKTLGLIFHREYESDDGCRLYDEIDAWSVCFGGKTINEIEI